MKHLKDLGVDVRKASMVLLFHDEYGESVGWEVENHGKDKPLYEFYSDELERWMSTTAEYFDAETGSYDHSYREECGVFTLQDMLDVIPKHLKIKVEEYRNPVDCILMIDVANDCAYYEYEAWGEYKSAKSINESNLINSAYDMLCWLVKNGHLEGDKQ